MKIINCSDINNSNKQPDIIKRFRLSSPSPTAAERFINYLNSALDNRFHLLSNVVLETPSEPIPYILLGPTGLWLINIFPHRGVFKITASEWLQLDEKSGRSKPLTPSPADILLNQVAMLNSYLSDYLIPPSIIEPLIFFSHPGAHVTLSQSNVKTVMMDAINRFVSRVITSSTVMNGDTIQIIIDRLKGITKPEFAQKAIHDGFSLREDSPPRETRTPTQLEIKSQNEPSFIRNITARLPLSNRQWILLGILVMINILIFLALVIVVVVNAGM